MPKSQALANSLLALVYNATPIANVADQAAASPITNIYVSLHTGNLTAATGTQSDLETAYTNYVRVAVARTTGGWVAPSAGVISNTALVQFAQCGVTGATITHVATGKVATGSAGIAYHYGALNAPLAVANLIQPQFAANALQIQES